MIKSILFNTKRLITIISIIGGLYIILLLFGYRWDTMKDFFPMISLIITVGVNELFSWIDKKNNEKKESFEEEYILTINPCTVYIKKKSLRILQELPSIFNKDNKTDAEKSLSDVFKNIHEQIGDIHNCMRNLDEELNNTKPKLSKKTREYITKTLSDRWNNYRTNISSVSDYILIIKEELSEYNDKLLKTIEDNDSEKFINTEKNLRKDIILFFNGLYKILKYVKYRY